jgi:hypothetical protein
MLKLIRCSGLARPMACAGSLFFTDLPPQETNAAAEEGTAAGEYLQYLLENNMMEPTATHAKNGVRFDDDIKFFMREQAEMIRERAQGNNIRCEQRIDWKSRSGILISGSYDVGYAVDDTLYIDDLKYGWGIVEVKGNWQLLGYAIGEVIRRGQAFKKIVLTIRQPRPHHELGPIREWVLTYDDLLQWKEKIDYRLDQIANGDQTLTTSDRCKYCPAGAVCPALSKAMYKSVEVVNEFIQDNIDDKELSAQLDLLARVTEVLKIRTDSLNALAIDRVKHGRVIPNYITEARYGDRKWKSSVTPQVVEALTGKRITTEQMLSPAQAEKVGIPKQFVAEMVDRHFLGQKLVRKDGSKLGDQIFGKPQELKNG